MAEAAYNPENPTGIYDPSQYVQNIRNYNGWQGSTTNRADSFTESLDPTKNAKLKPKYAENPKDQFGNPLPATAYEYIMQGLNRAKQNGNINKFTLRTIESGAKAYYALDPKYDISGSGILNNDRWLAKVLNQNATGTQKTTTQNTNTQNTTTTTNTNTNTQTQQPQPQQPATTTGKNNPGTGGGAGNNKAQDPTPDTETVNLDNYNKLVKWLGDYDMIKKMSENPALYNNKFGVLSLLGLGKTTGMSDGDLVIKCKEWLAKAEPYYAKAKAYVDKYKSQVEGNTAEQVTASEHAQGNRYVSEAEKAKVAQTQGSAPKTTNTTAMLPRTNAKVPDSVMRNQSMQQNQQTAQNMQKLNEGTVGTAGDVYRQKAVGMRDNTAAASTATVSTQATPQAQQRQILQNISSELKSGDLRSRLSTAITTMNNKSASRYDRAYAAKLLKEAANKKAAESKGKTTAKQFLISSGLSASMADVVLNFK